MRPGLAAAQLGQRIKLLHSTHARRCLHVEEAFYRDVHPDQLASVSGALGEWLDSANGVLAGVCAAAGGPLALLLPVVLGLLSPGWHVLCSGVFGLHIAADNIRSAVHQAPSVSFAVAGRPAAAASTADSLLNTSCPMLPCSH